MDLKQLVAQVLFFLQWTFAPKEKKAEVEDAAQYLPGNKLPTIKDTDTQFALEKLKAATTKEAEAINVQVVPDIVTEAPKKTTVQSRVRHILDLILTQELQQKYKDPETRELNIIHPDYARYIVTSGTGMASEFTEQRIQGLYKNKGFLYAEWYTYEALSAQWRKRYVKLITDSGKLFTNERGYAQFRANLHEEWRQTVWADKAFADAWLVTNRIADAELEEFLFVLASDDVEVLPSTDKPKG